MLILCVYISFHFRRLIRKKCFWNGRKEMSRKLLMHKVSYVHKVFMFWVVYKFFRWFLYSLLMALAQSLEPSFALKYNHFVNIKVCAHFHIYLHFFTYVPSILDNLNVWGNFTVFINQWNSKENSFFNLVCKF